MSEMAAEAESVDFRSGGEMITITEREISIIEDIIYNGKLSSVMINPNIWTVIQEETPPCSIPLSYLQRHAILLFDADAYSHHADFKHDRIAGAHIGGFDV